MGHVCKGMAVSPVSGSTERVQPSVTGRAVVNAGGGKRNCDVTRMANIGERAGAASRQMVGRVSSQGNQRGIAFGILDGVV